MPSTASRSSANRSKPARRSAASWSGVLCRQSVTHPREAEALGFAPELGIGDRRSVLVELDLPIPEQDVEDGAGRPGFLTERGHQRAACC